MAGGRTYGARLSTGYQRERYGTQDGTHRPFAPEDGKGLQALRNRDLLYGRLPAHHHLQMAVADHLAALLTLFMVCGVLMVVRTIVHTALYHHTHPVAMMVVRHSRYDYQQDNPYPQGYLLLYACHH